MSDRFEPNDQQLDWIERAVRDDLRADERVEFDRQLMASSALREAFEDALTTRRFFSNAPRPVAPDRLAKSVFAEIDRNESTFAPGDELGWWDRLRESLAWPQLARMAVPMAAIAVLLFAVWNPRDGRHDLPANGIVQRTPEGVPCELDMDEVFRSLGIKRNDLSNLDEKALCDAAEELKVAMAMLNRAMNRTGEVIKDETAGRLGESVNEGMHRGFGSAGKETEETPKNGG